MGNARVCAGAYGLLCRMRCRPCAARNVLTSGSDRTLARSAVRLRMPCCATERRGEEKPIHDAWGRNDGICWGLSHVNMVDEERNFYPFRQLSLAALDGEGY